MPYQDWPSGIYEFDDYEIGRFELKNRKSVRQPFFRFLCQKRGEHKDVCLTHLRGGLQWVVIFELSSRNFLWILLV